MPFFLDLFTVCCALAFPTALVFAYLKKFHTEGNVRYPPGPPSDPIIGHARSMPLKNAWKTFSEWRKKYGDVIFIQVLGRPIVILNSAAAVRALLEKRSAIFSDRPYMYVFGELIGWSTTLPLLRYGARFRKQRRILQNYFSNEAVKSFKSDQRAFILPFLRNLLIRPEKFLKDIHVHIANSILILAYDHPVTSEEDSFIQLVEKSARMSSETGIPGGTLLDLFPILRRFPTWFPGAAMKRHALNARKVVDEVMAMPYDEVKVKKAAGNAQPSFLLGLIEEYEQMNTIDLEYEEDIKSMGATAYGAGIDTTVGTLETFFLMMTLHPEVAKRAQEEIDSVVGSDRLPVFEDRPRLPYIECVMREVFRIHPPLPLALPHQSMEVEIFNGWTIPKGSMVLPNLWEMMRDGKIYSEPDAFRPERHMRLSSKRLDIGTDGVEDVTMVKEDDPSALVFGFGRRVCPGRVIADAMVWATICNVLAVFDIRPFINAATNTEEPPEWTFIAGVTSHPKPFKCSIVPRSEKHVHLIQDDT